MGKYDILFMLDRVIINIAAVALSASRFPKLIKDRKYISSNKQLAQYKNNDTCFVIGLGPSLKSVDLSKLDGDIIVTNRFIKFENASEIRPTFYCMTDGDFYNEKAAGVLREAIKKNPETTFILNGKYRSFAQANIPKFTNVHFAYMWSGFFNPKKEIDFSKVLPVMGNIVCFAIMLALNLKYKKIVLLGCDFNSFASCKPIHCYAEKTDKRQHTMAFELFCYSFVAYTHNLLNDYAKKHNIQIINATQGSLIDAYYYDEELARKLLKI